MHSGSKLKAPPFAEFVIIVSLLMSLTALSIDTMMPALPQIGNDLHVQTTNERQLVISTIFLGLGLGQLFFGPLSDKTGRKKAIYTGILVYIIGALFSAFSRDFTVMLAGRLLQGIGLSSPRAVTMALVRDRYEGRLMARVMSFATTVLILMPMVAPSIGQLIIRLTSWRSIFAIFVMMAIIATVWFAIRMPETLPPAYRNEFSFKRIYFATKEIISTPVAIANTVAAGLVGGAFLGYLNSAQQIYQELYALGSLFPIIFAAVAFSIGIASFLNARLVIRLGMRYLVHRALYIILALAIVSLGVSLIFAGKPPLGFLMAYLMSTFFCVGILFGNLNSLAMQPLGHLAGIGSAVVGSLSTLIQLVLGTIIGQNYNGTINPLILGIGFLIGITILVQYWSDAKQAKPQTITNGIAEK